jgi:3-oxoacyl-(acyl-carrier-protein) synthase
MYITDLLCISAQKTYNESFLDGEVTIHHGNRYAAQEPTYSALIPASLLRRMGKAVRMGVGAGLPLIKKNPELDGIILGTANGGLEDCLKFLNQIVDYNEGTLTPTNFVQSTPNSIAGNLALMSKNTGYNTTHVHKGLAFECALLDAILLLNEQGAKSVLLGSVDEISEYNYNIDYLNGYFKKQETSSETLLGSDSPGTVCGEASVMFVVKSELTDDVLAQIVDVDQTSNIEDEALSSRLLHFLERNGLSQSDVDAYIAGFSGDNRTDYLYRNIQNELFPDSDVYCFKNLVGDFPTASAFATWMAVQIINGKQLPTALHMTENAGLRSVKNVLIYNHYQGTQHGFILVRAI